MTIKILVNGYVTVRANSIDEAHDIVQSKMNIALDEMNKDSETIEDYEFDIK